MLLKLPETRWSACGPRTVAVIDAGVTSTDAESLRSGVAACRSIEPSWWPAKPAVRRAITAAISFINMIHFLPLEPLKSE